MDTSPHLISNNNFFFVFNFFFSTLFFLGEGGGGGGERERGERVCFVGEMMQVKLIKDYDR